MVVSKDLFLPRKENGVVKPTITHIQKEDYYVCVYIYLCVCVRAHERERERVEVTLKEK